MNDVVIKLVNLAKFYKLYDDPRDRLKEALHPFKKKYYNPFYALKGLDLEIKKGDVLGVVGRNGCGKSTLLKLITGVLQPSEGSISVKGKITALLELGAGLNPDFTGIDNIQFYAKILGLTDKELKKKLPSIISFAELGAFLNQPVKTYSSGMKSRLGFAVAVHVDPEILILDEVLAVGDALFRRKCYAKMEDFFKAGKTIIFVSHDINSINQRCNRAILINNGEIIMDGEPKDVTKYYEKLMFGQDQGIKDIISEINEYQNKDVVQVNNEKKVKQDNTNPYYIDGLMTKSNVVYNNYDVHMSSPVIKDKNGDKVNVLITGETYTYNYDIEFNTSAERVSISLGIKTEKGQKIAGASLSNMDDCIETVIEGEKYLVKWSFKCNFLTGFYYSDNGVSALIESKRAFLTKSIDAHVFKVEKKKNNISARIVDLDQKIKLEKYPIS